MRNVLVTGASRGLGLGIAKALYADGFRVLGLARKQNAAFEAALEEAERVTPGILNFVACDLSKTETFPDLIKGIREEFGPVYGLVNNAGVSAEGALSMMKTADIEGTLAMNVLSPILLTRQVLRSMMAEGQGRIVNISSVTAFTGYSGLSVYSATKAALVGFTRSLAREVGRTGISVNAVAPGFVDTDMTGGMTAEQRDQIMRRSALKRLVEVEDVAQAVSFLLSDRARNITGTVLTVDAGNIA